MEKYERTAAQMAASENFQRPSESLPPTIQSSIANLWARMAAIYGPAWTTSYGERDVTGTWATGLSGLTWNDMQRGLQACIDKPREFPPNLSQFRDLCKMPGSHHAPVSRAIPSPLEDLAGKAKIAAHWRKMWVVSGLKPVSILQTHDRAELETEFGFGPYKPWSNELIQKYCKKATKAIKSGQALPKFKAMRVEQ